MKTRPWSLFAALLALTHGLPAQEAVPAPARTLLASSAGLLLPEQLDELLGPIALYPDALIAIILPASTSSSEIVLAARYLQADRNVLQIDTQPWDDSVRALAHYPETIRWMDENLAWTKQLGEVFLAQPDDVMSALQRLRARALAAGHLFSNAQQQVVTEGGIISILPAKPEVIYAPYYSPQIVYFSRVGYSSFDNPFLSYGSGFSSGWWLAYHLDWSQRRIWVIDRHARERHWQENRDLRPGFPPPPGRPGYVGPPPWQTWHPTPNSPRPPRPVGSGPLPPIVIVQPAPFTGAPRFHQPPPNSSPPRPDPRPRLTPGATSARDPVVDRGSSRGNIPPVATVSPPASGPTEPASPTTPPRRSRPPGNSAPTPAGNPAPVSSTLTFTPPSTPPAPVNSPTPPPPINRTSETRTEQPVRSRSPREDRPAPSDRATSETRGRPQTPAPAAAPESSSSSSRSTPTPPAAAPAVPAPPAAPAPESTQRRGSRTAEP